MKRICILCLFALLLSTNAPAQSPATEVPATRQDVVQLFDEMHVQQQTRAAMEGIVKQQRAMVRDVIRKRQPQISDEELNRLDTFTADFMRDFPMDEMLNDMIPVYQKHLTKADVEAMHSFYSSPTGEKLLREMPAIMAESMQAMMPHMQQAMETMTERVEKMAKEGQQKKAPKPAAPPDKN
jgi:hypothetical protein